MNSAVCTIVCTNDAGRASRRNESGASNATRNKKTTRLEKVQSALIEDMFPNCGEVTREAGIVNMSYLFVLHRSVDAFR